MLGFGKKFIAETVIQKYQLVASGKIRIIQKNNAAVNIFNRVFGAYKKLKSAYLFRQLFTVDKYFQDEEAEPRYQMAGKEITPKLLLEAIRTLPEEKRTAILLYYFEGMTDVEIGKMFNTSRSTIQYRRTSSFELLKKYLEGHADEWEEW